MSTQSNNLSYFQTKRIYTLGQDNTYCFRTDLIKFTSQC